MKISCKIKREKKERKKVKIEVKKGKSLMNNCFALKKGHSG